MTRNIRTTLAVLLALGFIGSLSSWMRSGNSAQAAAAPAEPMTRTQYLDRIGCTRASLPADTWNAVERGQAQVGMGAVTLLCAMGQPDNVHTITTTHGETVFQTYHRAGQRSLLVEVSDGVVTAISD